MLLALGMYEQIISQICTTMNLISFQAVPLLKMLSHEFINLPKLFLSQRVPQKIIPKRHRKY